ncbi:MAG TPA: glycine cleavage system protein H [Dehalococcoidia bacterium]|nr:glycine cleavage system protein H [Dehalococcoidia bacterium]
MAEEHIETTIDKFTFLVKRGCWYSPDGVWVQLEEGRARVGFTDYLQQSSGDMAFVEVRPPGTELKAGDELASVETMKVQMEVGSPLSGTVVEVNERLEPNPELVNEEPYGEGWLAVIEPSAWDAERASLLSDEQYLEAMRGKALKELGKQ